MSQNLVSQLLGLNENQGAQGSQPAANGAPPQQAAAGSGWKNATKSLKFSDALQGINITPNFLFLMLFLGFTGWLWVVYFIRHHEPLANDVLGVGAARSATADADRALVAGIKKTLPVRTSPQAGDFYVPVPQGYGRVAASGDFGYASAYQQPAGALPLPPAPPAPSPIPPTPTPLSYSPYMLPQMQHGAYMVPVQQAAGVRARTIVNR